jgi:hypothetical protein
MMFVFWTVLAGRVHIEDLVDRRIPALFNGERGSTHKNGRYPHNRSTSPRKPNIRCKDLNHQSRRIHAGCGELQHAMYTFPLT